MQTLKRLLLIVALFVIFIPAAMDAAGLKIDRMKIYFENNRPEITVKRHYPLKGYAEIGYTGVGLLEGYWEVDGELLTNVKMMIPSGETIVIEFPEKPKIPTFVSGTHKIRLVITKPSQKITFPEAMYFVTTDEWEESEKSVKSKEREDMTCPDDEKQRPQKGK